MIKYLKYDGNSYEGIFMPLPGKQNQGHMMVSGTLLKDKGGKEVIFGLGRAEEVFIHNEGFVGFSNLITKPVIKVKRPRLVAKKHKEVQAVSKDIEEIVAAMRICAVDNIVYLREVKGINSHKLYGHLLNLEDARIIKRMGKDRKRGIKVKMLR